MKIEVKDVCKSFRKKQVLDNVNYTFISGNIYGLSGINGIGKSVLLKIICGLYKPSSGCVLYDGVKINQDLVIKSNVRALIDTPYFFPELTGFENLKVLSKITNKINDDDINKALDIVNLSCEKDKLYVDYSLGMKQKLGIAQVIMENPKVIILDEPFNGIDSESILKIEEYLKEMKKNNKIIIITSHIANSLEKLCDTIYKMG